MEDADRIPGSSQLDMRSHVLRLGLLQLLENLKGFPEQGKCLLVAVNLVQERAHHDVDCTEVCLELPD